MTAAVVVAALILGCVLVRLLLTPVEDPTYVAGESDEAYGRRIAGNGYHAGGRR